MNKFSNVEKVGEGAYGVVFKAIDLESNKKVAIKKIRSEHCDEGIPQTTLREISFLKELDEHPNLIRLLDIVSSQAHGEQENLSDF